MKNHILLLLILFLSACIFDTKPVKPIGEPDWVYFVITVDTERDLDSDTYGSIENINHLTDLIKSHNATATFFVTGRVGERFPHLVEVLRTDRFEVGSHAYEHEILFNYNFSEKERRLSIATEILGNPKSFRSPYHSIDNETIIILDDLGYSIDSSGFGAHYPYSTNSSIHKIPPSYYDEKPISSDTIRLEGHSEMYRIIKYFIEQQDSPKYVVFLTHSWEYINITGPGVYKKNTGTYCLEGLNQTLNLLEQDFPIKYITISELDRILRWT
jgi:peptidoglycan/xylan/chitin deacetylase (PgdA/CDA1 family)